MKLTKIAGALLAVLLITGSAAALPGAAPAQAEDNADDAQADDYANETAQDADEDDEMNESAGPDAAEAADRQGPPEDVGPDGERGPPTDMPAPVPDFVSDIHQLVNQKLMGDLDGNLGEQISDVTPGDDESSDEDSETADDETAQDEDTDTSSDAEQ